jgi:hypothetical protein
VCKQRGLTLRGPSASTQVAPPRSRGTSGDGPTPSESTEDADRGAKKQIYEQIFRTPKYFLFDPWSRELEAYRLVGGRYEAMTIDERGRLASEQLDLLVGVHDGELRLFARDGGLIATPREAAEHEHRRAEEALAELARLHEQTLR